MLVLLFFVLSVNFSAVLASEPQESTIACAARANFYDRSSVVDRMLARIAVTGKLPESEQLFGKEKGHIGITREEFIGPHGMFATEEEAWLAVKAEADARGIPCRLVDLPFHGPVSERVRKIWQKEALDEIAAWTEKYGHSPNEKDFGTRTDQIRLPAERVFGNGEYGPGGSLERLAIFSSPAEETPADAASRDARDRIGSAPRPKPKADRAARAQITRDEAIERIVSRITPSGELPSLRTLAEELGIWSGTFVGPRGLFPTSEDAWLAIKAGADARGKKFRLLSIDIRNPPSSRFSEALQQEALDEIAQWVRQNGRFPSRRDFGLASNQIHISNENKLFGTGEYRKGEKLEHQAIFPSSDRAVLAIRARLKAEGIEVYSFQRLSVDKPSPELLQAWREDALDAVALFHKGFGRLPHQWEFGTKDLPLTWWRAMGSSQHPDVDIFANTREFWLAYREKAAREGIPFNLLDAVVKGPLTERFLSALREDATTRMFEWVKSDKELLATVKDPQKGVSQVLTAWNLRKMKGPPPRRLFGVIFHSRAEAIAAFEQRLSAEGVIRRPIPSRDEVIGRIIDRIALNKPYLSLEILAKDEFGTHYSLLVGPKGVFKTAEDAWLAIKAGAVARGVRFRLLDVDVRGDVSERFIGILRQEALDEIGTWAREHRRLPETEDFGKEPGKIHISPQRIFATGEYRPGGRFHGRAVFPSSDRVILAIRARLKAEGIPTYSFNYKTIGKPSPELLQAWREDALDVVARFQKSKGRVPEQNEFGTEDLPLPWHRAMGIRQPGKPGNLDIFPDPQEFWLAYREKAAREGIPFNLFDIAKFYTPYSARFLSALQEDAATRLATWIRSQPELLAIARDPNKGVSRVLTRRNVINGRVGVKYKRLITEIFTSYSDVIAAVETRLRAEGVIGAETTELQRKTLNDRPHPKTDETPVYSFQGIAGDMPSPESLEAWRKDALDAVARFQRIAGRIPHREDFGTSDLPLDWDRATGTSENRKIRIFANSKEFWLAYRQKTAAEGLPFNLLDVNLRPPYSDHYLSALREDASSRIAGWIRSDAKLLAIAADPEKGCAELLTEKELRSAGFNPQRLFDVIFSSRDEVIAAVENRLRNEGKTGSQETEAKRPNELQQITEEHGGTRSQLLPPDQLAKLKPYMNDPAALRAFRDKLSSEREQVLLLNLIPPRFATPAVREIWKEEAIDWIIQKTTRGKGSIPPGAFDAIVGGAPFSYDELIGRKPAKKNRRFRTIFENDSEALLRIKGDLEKRGLPFRILDYQVSEPSPALVIRRQKEALDNMIQYIVDHRFSLPGPKDFVKGDGLNFTLFEFTGTGAYARGGSLTNRAIFPDHSSAWNAVIDRIRTTEQIPPAERQRLTQIIRVRILDQRR